MDRIVAESEAFKAKDEILQSIVGVGPQVSRTLLVHLPELGTGTRQSIAALVGLAPFADDSGASSRIRHIRGGRGKVRIALYQAAVAAIRYCATMKAFYASLKARGRRAKSPSSPSPASSWSWPTPCCGTGPPTNPGQTPFVQKPLDAVHSHLLLRGLPAFAAGVEVVPLFFAMTLLPSIRVVHVGVAPAATPQPVRTVTSLGGAASS